MEMPKFLQGDSLTRLWQGAALGAVITVAVGFNWVGPGFGWVTGGTARDMQSKAATSATTAALLTPCKEQFAANTAAMDKFRAMTSVYSREQLVRETVLKVNGVSPNSNLVDACAAAVSQDLSKAAAKS